MCLKMKKIPILIFSFIVVAFSSCYYNNEELMYPNIEICDSVTANVTYEKAIAPLIKLKCSGCHSTANKSFGDDLVLDNYDNVKSNIEDIYVSVKQDAGTDYPMPKNAHKLSDCAIDNFKKWADNDFPK